VRLDLRQLHRAIDLGQSGHEASNTSAALTATSLVREIALAALTQPSGRGHLRSRAAVVHKGRSGSDQDLWRKIGIITAFSRSVESEKYNLGAS
jgi:hypothetical protein